jgi:glycosyltransferase 2 family protein
MPGPCGRRRSRNGIVYKRLAINLLKYLLAIGVLTYVIYSNWTPDNGKGLSYVWERLVHNGIASIRWDYLLCGFLLFEAGVMLTLVRWYLLVRCQGLPLTLGNAFRLGMIGCFFNLVLPGSVGGDIAKAAALAREQSRRTVAVATVIMDRIIGLWGLAWLVGLVGAAFWVTGQLDGPAGEKSKLVIEITAGILAASLVVWFAMGFLTNERAEAFALRLRGLPKVGGPAAEFWRAVWMYRCQQRTVLAALALSWLGFGLFVPAFYYCAYTLWSPEMGAMPTFQQHFMLVPIGLLMRAVPFFPGGVGIGEASFAKLYAWFTGDRAAEASGLLGSLMQRVVEVMTGMIGFGVYMAFPARVRDAAVRPVPLPAEVPQQDWVHTPAESTTTVDSAISARSS